MKFEISSLILLLIVFAISCTKSSELNTISEDGVKISFEKKGKGTPAIVFVHGWSNNRSIWDEQIAHFSQKYTVIGIDLAGFGKSGNNRETWSTSAFGNDVVAVINELQLKKVVLVGFSMGGPVIVEAARKAPENIIGLVLVDTMQDIERQISDEELAYIDSVFMDLITNPTAERLDNVYYKENKEAAFARIEKMLEGVSHVGWRESLYEMARWTNEDCKESLKSIQCPVVAINTDTQETNEEAYSNLVPSFKVNIIPNTGHVLFWDKPDEFNNLLEGFIQGF